MIMFVIILLMLDSVIAAYFAKGYVKRNRGLMLDMPDWSLIPDMTVLLFQFIFSGFLLFSFYFKSKDNTERYLVIIIVVCICCLFYMVLRIHAVREMLGAKILEKFASNSRKGEEMFQKRNADKEKEEERRMHEKRFNDAVAYAEYTLLYTIRYSLVYLLVETVLYYALKEVSFSEYTAKEEGLLYIIQNDLQSVHALHVVLILEIVGVCLTVVRIIAVVQYVERKPARKPLEKIRDYLRSEEIKN